MGTKQQFLKMEKIERLVLTTSSPGSLKLSDDFENDFKKLASESLNDPGDEVVVLSNQNAIRMPPLANFN